MSDESAEAPAPVPSPGETPAVPIPSPGEAPAMPSELVDVKKEERPINLRVQDQQGGQVHFKVKFSTPMRKIFDMYAQKRGVAVNVLRFMLDGRRVRPEDTAATLGLEDDDQIDCLLEQIGG
jgi:small ubiquitin-related modifier